MLRDYANSEVLGPEETEKLFIAAEEEYKVLLFFLNIPLSWYRSGIYTN